MTVSNDGPAERRTTLDQTFDVLRQPSRRRILWTLAHCDPSDEDEFESADFEPNDRAIQSFERNLHHQHLPKLADAGFIDWNRETDTITHGPRFEEIRPFLTLLDTHQDELPEDWP